jgi:ATP-dependent DNA ligase
MQHAIIDLARAMQPQRRAGQDFQGLTDAMPGWQARELLALEVRRDATTVYVRPKLVAEIAFSDLQVSPPIPAGWRCDWRA